MFFSNSVMIVNISSKNQNDFEIRNVSFEKDKKFFSIMFDKNSKIGEIHWSESFLHGKINIINFIKINNEFFLFTSSTQNYKPFETIIKKLFGEKTSVKIKYITFPINEEKSLYFPELLSIELDKFFGINAVLRIENELIYTKIYSNGLITYTQVNQVKSTFEILKAIRKIIGAYEE
ncbi:hypothetical protein MRBLBA21_003779 [Peribacillus frigoritolerans]|uniref:hypothetical protein n=1 Tax=Peribacillus frigoritolerans TaxID=450367 RepID=UPI00341C71EF